MLVIRRRAGEGFRIGLDIEIEVLEVSPTRVKIGVVAPGALPIVRKEVLLTRRENLAASHNAAPHTIAWLSEKLGPAAQALLPASSQLIGTPAERAPKRDATSHACPLDPAG